MKYTGELTLNPDKNTLHCSINVSYVASNEHSELILLLHKDIVIDSIASTNLKHFTIDDGLSTDVPFILEAKKIILTFDKTLKSGEACSIDFTYHGYIPIVTKWGMNRIDEDFTELGLYTPWYPISVGLDESTFDITINIPDDYTVINGYQLTKDADAWHIIQNKPHNDCSFLAFKDCITMGHDLIKVYCFKEQEVIARKLFDTATKLFNYFTDLFGEVTMDKHLSLALPPRPKGGGYCRDGLIVLTLDGDDILKYLPFIAHEMAHLWWNKAPVIAWEDWLNESFAEYSSLMAIRALMGVDKYQTRIDAYLKASKELPPIKGIARADQLAFPVLYKKGPVLLHRLESQLGEKTFIDLLRRSHEKRIVTTRQFLSLLSEIDSQALAKSFDQWLET